MDQPGKTQVTRTGSYAVAKIDALEAELAAERKRRIEAEALLGYLQAKMERCMLLLQADGEEVLQ
jgi:hypothetical protein